MRGSFKRSVQQACDSFWCWCTANVSASADVSLERHHRLFLFAGRAQIPTDSRSPACLLRLGQMIQSTPTNDMTTRSAMLKALAPIPKRSTDQSLTLSYLST